MAQTHQISNLNAITNADLNPSFGFFGFGVGLPNQGSDASGVGHIGNTNASVAFGFADDGWVPQNSTVASVQTTIRGKYDFAVSNAQAYIRYNGGAGPVYGAAFTLGSSYANYTTTFTTDPASAAWTVANIFTASLRWGILSASGTPDPTSDQYFTQYLLLISFTLPPPTSVTTSAASGILGNIATLNGSFNPNTATFAFPCSYYFEWGLTTSYGNTTATVANQYGGTSIAASTGLTGLTILTTYHYRLVVVNGDNTVQGADQQFTTTSVIVDYFDEGEEG